jgi:hypothetical protein
MDLTWVMFGVAGSVLTLAWLTSVVASKVGPTC